MPFNNQEIVFLQRRASNFCWRPANGLDFCEIKKASTDICDSKVPTKPNTRKA